MSKVYKPHGHALQSLKQVDFVATVGPTAVGKTTLIKEAVAADSGLHMFVAGASRQPRPGEQQGVDFHFGSKADMQARATRGEYITVVKLADELYTTAPEDYPTDKVVLTAVVAASMPTFSSLPFRSFRTIFILPPSWASWQDRLKSRDFTPEQLVKRLSEASDSLKFALNNQQVQFVINQDKAVAVEDFMRLAHSKKLDTRQQSDQERGRQIAAELLSRLSALL